MTMEASPIMSSPAAGVRPRLPRLSGNEAAARSIIARHGAGLTLRLPSSRAADADPVPAVWQLRLSPGVVQAVLEAAPIRAHVEWAGARLSLALPPAACRSWLEARLPELEIDPLPPPLLATAVESMLADLMSMPGTASNSGPARVLDIDVDDAGSPGLPHGWTVTAQCQATGQTFFCALHADGLGLMLLAGALTALPQTDNELDLDSVPVRVCAAVGSAVLPAAELRSLQRHDVVMLDQYLVDPGGQLWLTVAGGQSLRVRQEHSSLIVTQGWTAIMTQTQDPSSEAEQQPAQDGLLDVDAIPVRLTFDLGERQLTLGELRRLQPGDIFDLHRPLTDGPVMVRANGALVGTGELVEVDGRIGVALSSLGKVGT